jgi:hypothetical protein
MSLKRLTIPVEETTASVKGAKKPQTKIAGNQVDLYVKACEALKAADAAKKETQEKVLSAGINLVLQTNLANPQNPVTTVEVLDDTGATAQVQFKDAYGIADGEAVSAVFDGLRGPNGKKLDVNDFVHETVKATFDSKIFLDDKGEFSQARYDAFKRAIDSTAAALNVPSPLTCKKMVTAKLNFHEIRWAAVPTLEAQKMIQQILPATVAGRPVCEGKTTPRISRKV